jgi:putative superfamily III holin-X
MDLLKLLDLQCQLVKVDIREFWSHARIALALVILGPACLMAAVPLGLYAIALYVRAALNVPLEGVLLVLTLVLMTGTACAMYWAWHRLVSAAKPLERSNSEFQENLRWMRSLLYEEAVAEKPPMHPANKG